MARALFEQQLLKLIESNGQQPPDSATWRRIRALSAQVQAQSASQSSMAAGSEMFNSSAIGVAVSSLDGTIYEVNAWIQELLGYSREELIGHSLRELSIYVDFADRETMKARLLEAGAVHDFEVMLRAKDGQVHHVLLNSELIKQDGEKHILTIFYDYTARKQAENTLRQSEQRYRALLDAAEHQARELALLSQARATLASEVDLPSMMKAIVEGVAETFGYTQVSLYLLEGDTLVIQHQVGYENDWKRIPISTGVCGRVARTGESVLLEDAHSDPDFLNARVDIVSEVCVPLFDKDRVVGVLNVETTSGMRLTEEDLHLMNALSEHIGVAIQRARLYADLQASEQSEREQRILAEALRDLAAALNNTLSLNAMLDHVLKHAARVMPPFDASRVIVVRDGVGRIIRAVGHHADVINKPLNIENSPCIPRILKRREACACSSVAGCSGYAEETLFGWVHSVVGAPMIAHNRVIGIIYLDSATPGTFNDTHGELLKAFANQAGNAIYKSRLYRRLRRQTKMRLQQAIDYERRVIEARSRFGVAVSHEFRTPLATIQTSCDLLRLYRDRLTRERHDELLQTIAAQVKHLANLLDDITLLSKVDLVGMETNPTTIDLDRFCTQIVDELQWLVADRHQIVFTNEGGCVEATLDEHLMRRVLTNLLTNAVKYSPNGGTVFLNLDCDDGSVIIAVRDQGIGIAEEELTKIFETFHRGRNVGMIPGTGLGLTIVKQAVEQQYGKIEVHSRQGEGSTFTLRLPLKPPTERERQYQ